MESAASLNQVRPIKSLNTRALALFRRVAPSSREPRCIWLGRPAQQEDPLLRLHLELLPLPAANRLPVPSTVSAGASWTVRALGWHVEQKLASIGLTAKLLLLLNSEREDEPLPSDRLVSECFSESGQTLRIVGDFQRSVPGVSAPWGSSDSGGGAASSDDSGSSSSCHIVKFAWRRETLDTFFATPQASTRSVPVTIDHPASGGEVHTFALRLLLSPAAGEWWDAAAPCVAAAAEAATEMIDAPAGTSVVAAPPPPGHAHTLAVVLMGAAPESEVYRLAFYSLGKPRESVHVAAPDHRARRYEAQEFLSGAHPLLARLREEAAVRMLVRVTPDAAALTALCGCC